MTERADKQNETQNKSDAGGCGGAGKPAGADPVEAERRRALLEKYGYKRPEPSGGGNCGSTKRRTCC